MKKCHLFLLFFCCSLGNKAISEELSNENNSELPSEKTPQKRPDIEQTYEERKEAAIRSERNLRFKIAAVCFTVSAVMGLSYLYNWPRAQEREVREWERGFWAAGHTSFLIGNKRQRTKNQTILEKYQAAGYSPKPALNYPGNSSPYKGDNFWRQLYQYPWFTLRRDIGVSACSIGIYSFVEGIHYIYEKKGFNDMICMSYLFGLATTLVQLREL